MYGASFKTIFFAGVQNENGAVNATLHGKLAAEMASGQMSDTLGQVMAEDQPRYANAAVRDWFHNGPFGAFGYGKR